MNPLIKKELTTIFCSGIGLIFALVFLLANGLMIWFFEGGFNILDAGYSTLNKFFDLSAVLFVVLIPALTMRLIAEEKRGRTLDLLRSRPLNISTIWFSKWIANFLFTILVILSTTVYAFSVHNLGNPVGNIDLQVVIVSYFSLVLLAGVFLAVGLFASSLTSNQIVAFIVALILNFILYYGFELSRSISDSGNIQSIISSCGLLSHYEQMQRGSFAIVDIAVFGIYFLLAWICSILVLEFNKKQIKRELIIASTSLAILFVATFLFSDLRFDFTKDKRYTLNEYSIKLTDKIAKNESADIRINVYLEGKLNAGFQRLQTSVSELLTELNKRSDYKLNISFVDPTSLALERDKVPEFMAKLGMPSILLNEVDRNGKMSQQLIYPYAQVIAGSDTLQVSLLKNTPGNTAEENLNASAEDLEFQFVDALRLITQNEIVNIAFIEGHGELPRPYVYDAEEALAKYYFVNRGQIGNDVSVLDNFKVVIIAGAKTTFSETEKYVLDQYLMKGGRIFWLIDGVYVSVDDLYNNGFSASIKNNTNLDDLLFTYGVRINPVLLQDAQSASIVVSTGDETQPATIPWYYAPLLIASPDNSITKNVSDVKAEFVSSINLLAQQQGTIKKDILLSTSAKTHVVSVPETVDLDVQRIQSEPNYFNESYLPVAVSMDGTFQSAFVNRPVPDSIIPSNHQTLVQSKRSKMIVVASSDIIRNEIVGQGENSQLLPMGFDHVSGRQYGNKDFIVNAVSWLADDDNLMSIRNKTRQLNLLNRQLIYEKRNQYALLNTFVPILVVIVFTSIIYYRRKRKYEGK